MIANPSPASHVPASTVAHDAARSGYRGDIDGLRALAVLPVVFYHAGVRGFSGGYIGVDIFFVISGFLITGILVRDVEAGRYSIADFYRRRVLRIFPALFTMMAIVTAVACATMLPSEIERFARSLAAAALFSSNIQFYLEADYFGLASSVKPLLHTWSLAVEEQWYILWPLLIGLVGASRSRLLAMAVGILVASFVFSVWQTAQDTAGAFFLLPSRAWELGLGALLAIWTSRTSNRWLLEGAGIVGLLLILASIKLYTHETSFPGAAAIAPCLGAALLIYSGSQGTWIGRLLSHHFAQFIGRISFSLYLWHWPVIVFTQIGLLLPQSPGVVVGQIALSLGLAVISWRYVEQPFREASHWRPTRTILLGAATAIVSAAIVAILAPTVSSKVMNLDAAQIELARYADLDGDALYRRGICFAVGPRSNFDTGRCLAQRTGKPAILFVGDSHAAALWPGLSLHTDRYDVLQATATGCVAKLYARPEESLCAHVINSGLRDAAARERPQATLLASRWKWRSLPGLEDSLRDSVVRAGHPILVGPIPEYFAALPRVLVFADRRQDDRLIDRSRDPDIRAIDQALREIAARTRTPYISMFDILCSDGSCITETPSGVPLQFDTGHLTPAGSEFVADAILSRVEQLGERTP